MSGSWVPGSWPHSVMPCAVAEVCTASSCPRPNSASTAAVAAATQPSKLESVAQSPVSTRGGRAQATSAISCGMAFDARTCDVRQLSSLSCCSACNNSFCVPALPPPDTSPGAPADAPPCCAPPPRPPPAWTREWRCQNASVD
eukprot:7389395-Prymnesium_polylepis.2